MLNGQITQATAHYINGAYWHYTDLLIRDAFNELGHNASHLMLTLRDQDGREETFELRLENVSGQISLRLNDTGNIVFPASDARTAFEQFGTRVDAFYVFLTLRMENEEVLLWIRRELDETINVVEHSRSQVAHPAEASSPRDNRGWLDFGRWFGWR
jgi:hypothetical protein